MFAYLTEIMLHSYFLAEAVTGRFAKDKRTLFTAFARVFLLSDDERERLFTLVQSKQLAAMTSEQQYMQYRRLCQFYALRAEMVEEDPETEKLIDIKGSALALAEKYKFPMNESVRNVACENLLSLAESGCVPFLVVLGVLLCEGIVTGKDEARGLQNLRKAAEWNSVEGLFAALRYDGENRERDLAALNGLLLRVGHARTAARVAEVYGEASSADEDRLLLEKAFAQGVVRRDVYSKAHARLIYSEAVGEKDKESIVLSPNKELFAEASALPLKLSYIPAAFERKELLSARPLAAEETGEIAARLENFDLRGFDGYRPLCISSGSAYMAERYILAMRRAFPGANLCRIELSDLAEYDLEPTKHNVFVRECAEDKFNIYLLFFRGEVSERTFDAAKNFLSGRKRRKFHLIHPGISIDLSPVLPVCFSDGEWTKRLEDCCDVVRLSPPSREEKAWLPEEIFAEKCGVYSAKNVTMAEGVRVKLCGYTADEMEKILDAAVREHRRTAFRLTEANVEDYYRLICEKHNTYYGFGGQGNGYTE